MGSEKEFEEFFSDGIMFICLVCIKEYLNKVFNLFIIGFFFFI